MNAINPVPLTVAVNPGSLVTSSPCKVCRHWATGPGPSVCINWPDCPLRIPRQPVSCFLSPEGKTPPRKPMTKDVVKRTCPFEGCTKKTQYDACWGHRRTIERRKARGITGEALYLAGDIRGAQ